MTTEVLEIRPGGVQLARPVDTICVMHPNLTGRGDTLWGEEVFTHTHTGHAQGT
jgi:hypothetical protein